MSSPLVGRSLDVGASPHEVMQASAQRGRWWGRALRVFRRDKLAALSLVIVVALLITALLPGFVATHSPRLPGAERLAGPSLEHLMGTDQFGRDIFSRVTYGAQVSMSVGVVTVFVALLLGIPLGAIAGFRSPSRLDNAIMRVMDIVMAFPPVILAIAVIAALGTEPIELGFVSLPHITKLMVVIGLLYVPQIARIVRGGVLVEREEQYVIAAKALGSGVARILFRDVLRNCISPVIVHGTLLVAAAIITEASLSFLGLGIQPPNASWGGMLSDARTYVDSGEWWMTIFPGTLIFITVLALNVLGDALRDVLDPRQISAGGRV